MSREIDMSGGLEGLGEEDLKYLRDRGRLTPDQERQFLGSIENTAPSEPNISERANTGDVNAEAPPAMETLRPDDDDESIEVEALSAPYSGYNKGPLETEIARRNANRPEEDHIVPDGDTKQDLIDALEADDEEQED